MIKQIRDWGLSRIPKNKHILITGPCSAETREQVFQSCEGVAAAGADMLRAGIWKPRTRPNSFEGVGKQGLPWIKEAGLMTGLPVCVEVAKAQHVEACLKAGIDVFWIGARTTVNPFAVQEIADALQGVDIPVMVKNPLNPDLNLWIGAIERLQKAGIDKIAAIHRGFSVYNSAKYRNQPQWELPIELHRRMRGLEIICDPSHIAGCRTLLLEVAQCAMNLGFDGLMIESHINPNVALSDAKQQLTPQALKRLLAEIVYKGTGENNPVFQRELTSLRKEIDAIDDHIMQILAQRMQIAEKIGACKAENNVMLLQIERWAEIYKQRSMQASTYGLSSAFIKNIYTAIHQESIRKQTVIEQEKKEEKK